MTTSDQQGNAPAPGGPVNQFGFPADQSTYAQPVRSAGSSRPTGPVVRSSGGGSNLGTWLVVAVIAIALVGGGLLLFRGLGKTAQAGAQTGVQAIQDAHDTDAKLALTNAAQAMETWFTDHQNYAIKGPVKGLSSTSSVQFWASAQSYCLRAYSPTGSATGPVNGSYWWYDSQGGGLQGRAGPKSPSAGACASATSFTALN
jgi:hypothetical protein